MNPVIAAAAAAPSLYAPSSYNLQSIAFVLLTVLCVSVTPSALIYGFGERNRALIAVGFTAIAGAIGFGILLAFTIGLVNDERTAHQVSVQEWLQDEHGVTVTDTDTANLLDGESVAVDRDGELTRIVFATHFDDTIIVVNETTGDSL